MYVKVYTYQIRPDKVADYIKIQQMAERIYSEYAVKTTLHLNSKEDPTKWMEIHQYKNEEAYHQTIGKVNARSEIKELFAAFLNVLIADSQEIEEEDYTLVDLKRDEAPSSE